MVLKKHLINPCVSVEPDGKADCKENTSVPVNQDEDVENHFGDSESIREVCPGLGLVEELKHSVDPRHPVQTEDDRAGNLDTAMASTFVTFINLSMTFITFIRIAFWILPSESETLSFHLSLYYQCLGTCSEHLPSKKK